MAHQWARAAMDWMWQFISWIGRLCHWLARHPETRPFRIILVSLFIVAAGLLLLPSALEIRLRYTGLILELFGLRNVAVGLKETRMLFGKPPFGQSLAEIFRSRPPRHPPQQSIASGAGVSVGSFAPMGYATGIASVTPTLEERVSQLERRTLELNQQLQVARGELDTKIRAQSAALEVERDERMSQDDQIRKLVDKAVAGGLTLEFIGVVGLGVGLIFSTASQEIAQWLSAN